MTGESDVEKIARSIVYAWIRECDSTVIKMRCAPDVINPLIDAIAKAIAAVEAHGRAKGCEEGAQIAEACRWSAPTADGEWALRETAKVIAAAIRLRLSRVKGDKP